eukprot:1145637-Pelagomonas_calceolata.AAC.1
MHSPLEYNPNHLYSWSPNGSNTLRQEFGAICNALPSKLSGFSSCHPKYDDHAIHLEVDSPQNMPLTLQCFVLHCLSDPTTLKPCSLIYLISGYRPQYFHSAALVGGYSDVALH